MSFPKERRRQIHSANTLERLSMEIRRRADLVGIFPNCDSVLRLLGSAMMEQNDEWIMLRVCFSQESMGKLLPPAEARPWNRMGPTDRTAASTLSSFADATHTPEELW